MYRVCGKYRRERAVPARTTTTTTPRPGNLLHLLILIILHVMIVFDPPPPPRFSVRIYSRTHVRIIKYRLDPRETRGRRRDNSLGVFFAVSRATHSTPRRRDQLRRRAGGRNSSVLFPPSSYQFPPLVFVIIIITHTHVYYDLRAYTTLLRP